MLSFDNVLCHDLPTDTGIDRLLLLMTQDIQNLLQRIPRVPNGGIVAKAKLLTLQLANFLRQKTIRND